MNGMVYEFRWKYRQFEDELVVMCSEQVFKLMVFTELGRPTNRGEIGEAATNVILENIVALRQAKQGLAA